MSESFIIEAEVRTDTGKGASRRLRHSNQVPAVLYGAGEDPVALTLSHNEMFHHLENEAFYSHILTINVGKKKEKAILKDLQRHPAKPRLMHADFQRVNMKEKLRMHVPLHFINEETSPGVKAGGLVTHSSTELHISCLPTDLPEFIEVDLGELELDASLHISDLTLPKGIESVNLSHGTDSSHDDIVAAIHLPRAEKADDEDEAPAEAAADDTATEGESSEES